MLHVEVSQSNESEIPSLLIETGPLPHAIHHLYPFGYKCHRYAHAGQKDGDDCCRGANRNREQIPDHYFSFVNDEEARHAAEELLKAQIEATARYEELNRKLRQFLEELQKMRSQPKQSLLDESSRHRNSGYDLRELFTV
jgi:hypothetical protein